MKDAKKAFQWIINILERHNITYRISGGLAARAYGVDRELADVDIEIAEADIFKIIGDVKPYIIFGPGHYKDTYWDLQLLTLKYAEQDIDICGIEAKIYNQNTKEWQYCSINNNETIEYRSIFGKIVPVEDINSLILYKKKLGREVDLLDISQLEEILSTRDRKKVM